MQIVAKELSYIYNKKSKFPSTALDNISLTICEGEFVGIIGHTGSGKSTFLQHINRLIPVQSGFLQVGEYNLSPQNRKQEKQLKKNLKDLRSKVGMVFQYPEYQLFAESVFADVAFGITRFMPQKSQQEVANMVAKALYRVGLDYNEVKDKSPFELSGGQKRRVALAGVIVTEPEILILDEPLAGLDPFGKIELMNLLKELRSSFCKTLIMVSHDMDEVCDNCSRVIVFEQGKIALDGSPKEIFSQIDKLREYRLDCPVTAIETKALSLLGIDLQNDLTTNSFVNSVLEAKK